MLQNEAPHPSIVICRGDDMTTGQIAKEQADADDVVDDGVVRSPKIFLGRDNNFYPIPGRKDISREDLVSCVLTNLVSDANRRENSNFDIQRAVFTIPVTFDGKSREELRSAAKKSGIDVVYFVHEPLAALYGFFKEQVSKELSIQAFEGKFVLLLI